MTALPQPPPESQLIAACRSAMDPVPSMRRCAREAAISPERWRQVETGVARVARGTDVPVRDVPAATLARMARVVGATPGQLRKAGRPDAASELEAMTPRDGGDRPEIDTGDLERAVHELTARVDQLEAEKRRGQADASGETRAV